MKKKTQEFIIPVKQMTFANVTVEAKNLEEAKEKIRNGEAIYKEIDDLDEMGYELRE
jgi:hypothetical protein